jgi:hypothetical protein
MIAIHLQIYLAANENSERNFEQKLYDTIIAYV